MESSRAEGMHTVPVTNERTNERGGESSRANFHIYFPVFRAPRLLTYGALVRHSAAADPGNELK